MSAKKQREHQEQSNENNTNQQESHHQNNQQQQQQNKNKPKKMSEANTDLPLLDQDSPSDVDSISMNVHEFTSSSSSSGANNGSHPQYHSHAGAVPGWRQQQQQRQPYVSPFTRHLLNPTSSATASSSAHAAAAAMDSGATAEPGIDRSYTTGSSQVDSKAVHDLDVKYQNYRNRLLSPLPVYLSDVYDDPILLNFQILLWYEINTKVIIFFRLVFALLYYSVPFTVAAFLVWVGLVDAETASVLELLLLSFYTAPVLSRAYSEVTVFFSYIPIYWLIFMQLDILLIVSLYLTSATTSDFKSHLAPFLTGLSFAVPAFLVYCYLVYHRYTMYAFGFITHYYHVPQTLVKDYTIKRNWLERVGAFKLILGGTNRYSRSQYA